MTLRPITPRLPSAYREKPRGRSAGSVAAARFRIPRATQTPASLAGTAPTFEHDDGALTRESRPLLDMAQLQLEL